jgi:glycosyltransferase involved in cell wall biosynthesis
VRLLVTSESHASCGNAGDFYADGPANYLIWSNYLRWFDEVVVLIRVRAGRAGELEKTRADGPGVSFCPLPDYVGPWQYLGILPELRVRVQKAIAECDAFILHVPGLIGRLTCSELRKNKVPYALDVVGDPWDALGPGAWPNPFRPIFRRLAASNLRGMCRDAMAIRYVTKHSLQRRYPPGKKSFAVAFSDILTELGSVSTEIAGDRYRRLENMVGGGAGDFRIGFIGSLARLYKGPDVMLRAVALCRDRGLDCRITIVGDGQYAEAMKVLARRLQIDDRTTFVEKIPFGNPVLVYLDSVDLFAMPSRQEGLPRALVEAMSRGCPCIGSNVGGIPELLDEDDLVPPNDPQALARKILEIAGDPRRMRIMSERNLKKAAQYDPMVLTEKRSEFYDYVKRHSKRRATLSRDGR